MPEVQNKRGDVADLESVNPTPLDGELLVVSDENTLKIGNGTDAYTSLAYVTATPRSHKSTHATGGSDALSPADIGAAPAASPTFTGVITVSAASGSAGSYAPSLTFSGDSNTGFGQVSGQSDTASVFTAGHERVRVDSSGRFLVGATSGRNLGGFTPSLIEGTDANGSRLAVVQNTNNTAGAGINLCKSRGTSVGSVTIVQSGDTLGSVFFNGADGTDLSSVGASVSAQVDGTPAANDLPGRLVFSTTASGSQIPTERLRITSAGNVGIGTTSPSALLDINADKIRLRTAKTPASASDAGNAGDICWDASYLYICTATNTWRRIAHSTW